MKRTLLLCALVFACAASRASAQITVTLGGPGAVASANDFATTVFQDPWDMNQRTDVGWWLNSVDQPYAGFTTSTFANGLFSDGGCRPELWLSSRARRTSCGRQERQYLRHQRGRLPHRRPADADCIRLQAQRLLPVPVVHEHHLRSARPQRLGPVHRRPAGGSTSWISRRSDSSMAAKAGAASALAAARPGSRRCQAAARSTSTDPARRQPAGTVPHRVVDRRGRCGRRLPR